MKNKDKKMFDFKAFNLKAFLTENGLYLVVLAMVVFTSFVRPNFFSLRNLSNILANSSVRFIIAMGVSGTLITRGTDLSAGRITGFAAVITGTLVQRPDFAGKFFPDLPDMPIIIPFLIVLVVGALLGLVNGVVVAYLKVPAFLGTLGAQIYVFGLNMLYSKNRPIGTFKPEFLEIGSGKMFGFIPYLAVIAAVIGVGMWVLYNKTKHGKYMYAIGGNEEAAEVSGVNVGLSKLKIYTLAGMLYATAGYLLAAKTGSVGANGGFGYELEAIASATIGGVSTAGGEGTIPGVLLGVMVFELLKTSLNFLGVSPEMVNVIQGLVIIVAVALDIRKTMEKR